MSTIKNYPRISRFKTTEAFKERMAELNIDLPVDEKILTAEENSPMAAPIEIFGKTVGNRWCIHPMEGWDGKADGMPSEHTLRRWRRFGGSGAKLIFGGEAAAVCHEGRANPRQIMSVPENKSGFENLLNELKTQHQFDYGTTEDLLVGLQLTHSGRYCKPNRDDKPEARIIYHHPILDQRHGITPDDDSCVMSDDDLDRLIDLYVNAAKMAHDVGFEFVDLKHCHGYLGHELLSAYTREGKYGGSFENRTRFLRTLVDRIRSEIPGLNLAVRVSAFDFIPFHPDEATSDGKHKGYGIPESFENILPYRYGFGVNQNDPVKYDLSETCQFLALLQELDIELVNITCGSPYYNPHIQRPALFPPSDGYRPPEDPLAGVARQIEVVRQLKEKFPDLIMIGTGYTYLQEFLPQVAQAVVRQGWADMVGIGRMTLIYPTLPADSLYKGELDSKHICRTFSDCTTAPRHGMISGCYPLDDYYKALPEAEKVKTVKKGL